jgi:predicted transcriptional regulator
MKVVTIGVASKERASERLAAAFAGRPQRGPRLTFASHALMWRVLTPNRWAVLETMTGAGPLALREIARRVSRDVKGVHTDVHALLEAGVINRTESGAFEFPYDAVRVDFTLKAAA